MENVVLSGKIARPPGLQPDQRHAEQQRRMNEARRLLDDAATSIYLARQELNNLLRSLEISPADLDRVTTDPDRKHHS